MAAAQLYRAGGKQGAGSRRADEFAINVLGRFEQPGVMSLAAEPAIVV